MAMAEARQALPFKVSAPLSRSLVCITQDPLFAPVDESDIKASRLPRAGV